MPPRSPRSLNDRVLALLNLLICLGCIYALINMNSSWWNARSWQAVHGTLVHAEIVKRTGKRRGPYIPPVSYTYSVEGTKYTGHRLTPGWFPGVTEWQEEKAIGKLTVGQPLIVWMNPRQPGQSVIYRDVDWLAALSWILVALLTSFVSWKYFRPNPTPE
jgi:hypothetical protein